MNSKALTANARLKAASGVITNLGSALVAAAAARWFALGFDGVALVWMIAAAMIIWAGIHMLGIFRWSRPMNDLSSNLAPALIGLLAAAAGLFYARRIARRAERARRHRPGIARPAE